MNLEDILGTYIITAAERGCLPDHKQLDAFETYAAQHNAEILVVPIDGQNSGDLPFHDRFNNYRMISSEHELGRNISISQFPIKAQQINPLTGLRRFAQRSNSIIVGSPKLNMQLAATSPSKLPKMLISTGACTIPNYKNNRIGAIGEQDHRQGGVILNTDNDKFHIRHVQCISDGSFTDLGIRYYPTCEYQFVGADTMVWGDLHNEVLDEQAYQATVRLTKEVKPKIIVLHDIFDGQSITHHDIDRNVTRARKAMAGGLDLSTELSHLGSRLEEISGLAEKVYVVKSNHDEVLDKYLESGRFGQDAHNLDLGAQIHTQFIKGKDALKVGLELVHGKLPKNIVFLQRDSELRRRGYELGFHGDKGVSGGRGSLLGLEYSLGSAIVGHTHSPARLRDLLVAGTLSRLDLDYNKGSPGAWLHSNVLVNKDGTAQHANIIDGTYKRS